MTDRMKRTRILYGFLVQVLILSYVKESLRELRNEQRSNDSRW
jgi:hypothetical protein